MKYAYIRVSTGGQTVENQRFEINNYCKEHNITIDKWIEETISGTKDPEQRLLGDLLKKLKKDDTLICTEISRIGRSLYMIMNIFNTLSKKHVQFYTIKEGFILDDSISSKVVSFAFSLTADIERSLISQRTKEALALRKAQGIQLGRPVGSRNKHHILEPYTEKIIKWKKDGRSNNWIKNRLHCHLNTLKTYLQIINI